MSEQFDRDCKNTALSVISDIRTQLKILQQIINDSRSDPVVANYLYLPPELDGRVAEALAWLSGARVK